MKSPPSLALRIVGFLIVAQLTAFVLGWAATTIFGFLGWGDFVASIDSLAVTRVADLVVRSLVRNEEGVIRIEPIPELRAEMLRAPAMRYAAFDPEKGRALAGSTPELVAVLERVVDMSTTYAHFVLPGDPKGEELGFMGLQRTPYGRVHIATYRSRFRWEDIFYSLRGDLYWFGAYIAAAMLVSAATAWIAVRQGLSPLSAVADRAVRIDMDSLHQRLPLSGVPAEIMTLVDSMNGALARLDAGAARMRRYTANAAHELRTPLAIMRARLEDTEEPSFKSDLMRDASQLQAIVEQLLVAARMNERQSRVDEAIDLVAAVSSHRCRLYAARR